MKRKRQKSTLSYFKFLTGTLLSVAFFILGIFGYLNKTSQTNAQSVLPTPPISGPGSGVEGAEVSGGDAVIATWKFDDAIMARVTNGASSGWKNTLTVKDSGGGNVNMSIHNIDMANNLHWVETTPNPGGVQRINRFGNRVNENGLTRTNNSARPYYVRGDDTNDHIVDSLSSPNASFSIEVWFQLSDLSRNAKIFWHGDDVISNFELRQEGNRVVMFTNNLVDPKTLSSRELLANTRYHMVYTWNGTGGSHFMHINSRDVTSGSHGIGDLGWTPGSEMHVLHEDFRGTVYKAQIFDRVLSVDEISSLYNRTLGWKTTDYDGDGVISVLVESREDRGGGDCNDFNANIYPEHSEVCDLLDNDCDDLDHSDGVDPSGIDEGVEPQPYFEDGDGDGHGGDYAAVLYCPGSQPSNYYPTQSDCDDTEISVWEETDRYVDNDRDGHGAGTPDSVCLASFGVGFSAFGDDCNDRDSRIRPGLTDVCDGLDNDCDDPDHSDGVPDAFIDEDFKNRSGSSLGGNCGIGGTCGILICDPGDSTQLICYNSTITDGAKFCSDGNQATHSETCTGGFDPVCGNGTNITCRQTTPDEAICGEYRPNGQPPNADSLDSCSFNFDRPGFHCLIEGTCVEAVPIGSSIYTPERRNPRNDCEACVPDINGNFNSFDWTNIPHTNISCNADNSNATIDECVIGAGVCEATLRCAANECYITGLGCVSDDKPGNSCFTCDPDQDDDDWSYKGDETPCTDIANDGNTCTTRICLGGPSAGACENSGIIPARARTLCNDGDACTGVGSNQDHCVLDGDSGRCESGGVVTCTLQAGRDSQCNTAYCDSANGGCVFAPLPADTECYDGDECSWGETCVELGIAGNRYGECRKSNNSEISNPCFDGDDLTNDACTPIGDEVAENRTRTDSRYSDSNQCPHVRTGDCFINGTPYDHNQDNENNSCQYCDRSNSSGWTNRGNETVCGAGSTICSQMACNNSTGQCTDEIPKPGTFDNATGQGTICNDDGQECTEHQCTATGSCERTTINTAGSECNSGDGNECTYSVCSNTGTCDLSNTTVLDQNCEDALWNECSERKCDGAGSCTLRPKNNGDVCVNILNSGSCRINRCDVGFCTNKNNTLTGDYCGPAGQESDPVCQQNQCDGAGNCSSVNIRDGEDCDDGNVCTASSVCNAGGRCEGSSNTCADTYACTDDNVCTLNNGSPQCVPSENRTLNHGGCFIQTGGTWQCVPPEDDTDNTTWRGTNGTDSCYACIPGNNEHDWSPRRFGDYCDDNDLNTHSDSCQDDGIGGRVCEGLQYECNSASSLRCGTDVGVCSFGTRTCILNQADPLYRTWERDGNGDIICNQASGTTPGAEVCDTLDNDCDGSVDEGVTNACGGCAVLPATPNDAGCSFPGEVDQCLDDIWRCHPQNNNLLICENDGTEKLEICGDGIDNDCIGGDDVCPVSVTGRPIIDALFVTEFQANAIYVCTGQVFTLKSARNYEDLVGETYHWDFAGPLLADISLVDDPIATITAPENPSIIRGDFYVRSGIDRSENAPFLIITSTCN